MARVCQRDGTLPRKFANLSGMSDDLANLAHHVKARREATGWSQMQIWKERNGPSNTKLTQIEAGLPPSPSPSTRKKLDEGLGWVSGSTDEVLAGGSPVVAELPTNLETTVAVTDAMRDNLEIAQANFERAVADLVRAENEMDAQMRLWATVGAFNQKVERAVLKQSAQLARPLTRSEVLGLEISPVTAAEVAEYIAWSAAHDPREWTRYELALVEHVFDDGESDRSEESTYASMNKFRERVRRLNPTRERDIPVDPSLQMGTTRIVDDGVSDPAPSLRSVAKEGDVQPEGTEFE